jgi:hypothetical protein
LFNGYLSPVFPPIEGSFCFQVQETILPILLHRPSARRVMNKMHKKMGEKTGEKCEFKKAKIRGQ